MCSNKVLDKKPLTEPEQEPVDLEAAKAWMNVDFEEKNDIIMSLIPAARRLLEDRYDIGIVKKRLQVIVDNSCGDIELPGAPVSNVTGFDRNGETVTVSVIGDNVAYLQSPCSCYVKVTYDSGYDVGDVPEIFKKAIKQQVAWMFSNLNDMEVARTVAALAEISLMPYRRNGMGVFL